MWTRHYLESIKENDPRPSPKASAAIAPVVAEFRISTPACSHDRCDMRNQYKDVLLFGSSATRHERCHRDLTVFFNNIRASRDADEFRNHRRRDSCARLSLLPSQPFLVWKSLRPKRRKWILLLPPLSAHREYLHDSSSLHDVFEFYHPHLYAGTTSPISRNNCSQNPLLMPLE